MEIQVRYLTLLLLSSIKDSFRWLWMGSLHKNIQLMLKFLKTPFLILHFSFYTLINFLMMLSVILLSMLMILLPILSLIRHLICGNNQNWLLNLNLIYKTKQKVNRKQHHQHRQQFYKYRQEDQRTKNELFRKTRLQVYSFKDLPSRTTPGCLLPPRNEETYPKTYLKILKGYLCYKTIFLP